MILLATDPLSIAVFALLYGCTYWATAPLTVIFVRDLFGGDPFATREYVIFVAEWTPKTPPVAPQFRRGD